MALENRQESPDFDTGSQFTMSQNAKQNILAMLDGLEDCLSKKPEDLYSIEAAQMFARAISGCISQVPVED